MKPPSIYISGLYRSGTTLLANILNSHSKISITYGTVHFMRNSYNKYHPISDNYERLVLDTRKRILNKWEIDFDYEGLIKELNEQKQDITQALVYDQLMRSFLKLSAGDIWGEKTNVEWEGLLPFASLFPNGKAIHIVRDPRAVLASFKYFTFHPEPMYLDAIFSARAMFDFIEQKEIVENDQIMLLFYEDLIKHPNEKVQQLCDFLNVDFEEDMINRMAESSGPYKANSSFKKSVSGISDNSLDIWKEKLSNVDIYLCEKFLRPYLKKYGYSFENITLGAEDELELKELINHPFIAKRIRYLEDNGTGQQAFPDTPGAYEAF